MSTLCTYRTLAIASAIHLYLWLKLGQKNQIDATHRVL